MKNCKNCIHFKNGQRELNYWGDTGFCTSPDMNFNTNDGRLVGVVDRGNVRDQAKVSGNPSHDFESRGPGNVKHSRYSLAVSANFGCILHIGKEEDNE